MIQKINTSICIKKKKSLIEDAMKDRGPPLIGTLKGISHL